MSKQSAYQRYLKSEHWKKLRSVKLDLCPYCISCKATFNLRAHHIEYRNLSDCEVSDLAILCNDCHEDLHAAIKLKGYKIRECPESFIPSLVGWYRGLSKSKAKTARREARREKISNRRIKATGLSGFRRSVSKAIEIGKLDGFTPVAIQKLVEDLQAALSNLEADQTTNEREYDP